MLTAKDLISPNTQVLSATDPVKNVVSLFAGNTFQVIPVVDGSKRLQGMFSTTDLMRSRQLLDTKEFLELLLLGLEADYPDITTSFNLSTYQEAYDQLCVKDMMSPVGFIAKSSQPLEDIASLFIDQQAAVVAVVDEEQHYLGLINSASLVKKALCTSS